MKKYVEMELDGNKNYVKKDRVDNLRKVDAVVFDCDGVLIDIRESYNKTISEAVVHIINELTGHQLPADLVSREVIYLYKRSGGFNNDWDLTYAILLSILFNMPEGFREVFQRHANLNLSEENMFKRFSNVKKGIREEYILRDLDDGSFEDVIQRFAEASDSSGIIRIEEELVNRSSEARKFYTSVKHFLSYPGGVEESLLTSIFEEIFCGSELFKDIYNLEPGIGKRRGLIEDEKVIINGETLDQLTSLLEKANFGIASGRSLLSAKHTLKGLLDRFSSKALIFLDDITAAESEAVRNGEVEVSLKKPNPYSLFMSCEYLKPFDTALYVGDSMEDALVVREANRDDLRFLFVGVYGYSDCEDEVLKDFFEFEAEAILHSVNDLPTVLRRINEGEIF